jgi:hypothetical protein
MRPYEVRLDQEELLSLLALTRQGDGGAYLSKRQRLQWESGLEIDLSAAMLWGGAIRGKKRERGVIARCLANVQSCWETHAPVYGLADEYPDWRCLPAALRPIMNATPEDEERQLDYWVGRGPGLTPSGDDLLVGLAAVMHWATYPWPGEVFSRYLMQRGHERTTAVSCEYLHYIAQGIASVEVNALLEAMGDQRCCPAAFSRMLALGHTSGADTIVGILCGLLLKLEESL